MFLKRAKLLYVCVFCFHSQKLYFLRQILKALFVKDDEKKLIKQPV